MNAKTVALLIDSDPAASTALRSLLSQLGFAVRVAVDGKSALQQSWDEEVDLILMDPDLPDVSGIELSAYFKTEERIAEVPLAWVSRRYTPQLIALAEQLAIDALIDKAETWEGIASEILRLTGTLPITTTEVRDGTDSRDERAGATRALDAS